MRLRRLFVFLHDVLAAAAAWVLAFWLRFNLDIPADYEALMLGLKVVGIVVLLWLSWKIATAGRARGEERERPIGFWTAVAFQWVNPKAWVMAVAAMATYTDENQYTLTVMLVGLAFAAVNLPSVSTWAGFGSVLREWLSVPARLKWFNITMAVLLVLSLWPMLK